MEFKVYARRAIKSILYIAIIFMLLLSIMYIFGERKDPNIGFLDMMIPPKNQVPMIGFIVVFGLIYPFLTYIKKNVYLNSSFDEEREAIMRVFITAGYELTAEEGKTLSFRPKNKVARFMRMMEDTVTVNYSDNPIVISGIRKEAYRLAKHIEHLATQKPTEE